MTSPYLDQARLALRRALNDWFAQKSARCDTGGDPLHAQSIGAAEGTVTSGLSQVAERTIDRRPVTRRSEQNAECHV